MKAMKYLECSKYVVLACILLLCTGIGTFMRYSPHVRVYFSQYDRTISQLAQSTSTALIARGSSAVGQHPAGPRYLSYQPPGNGWNNQRIALENALVLAKLLNRTLIIHPLAPHVLGVKMKAAGRRSGYQSYNLMTDEDLLPPALFLDLQLMSQLVPVVAVNTSHPQFVDAYSDISWTTVCHSVGFGYWVDQHPVTGLESELLSKQRFRPYEVWRKACAEEQHYAEWHPKRPIERYVSDLKRDKSEMLYFEQGTLFAIQIRFTTREKALMAQKWILDHVRYSPQIWRTVNAVAAIMGRFNAIHVRRRYHMDKHLPASYWLNRMVARNFSTSLPVYVATDQYEEELVQLLRSHGFTRLFSAQNFTTLIGVSKLSESLRSDFIGIHEQCICQLAQQFIPSPGSTFAAYILRRRGEVPTKDGLLQERIHAYWIGHQTRSERQKNS